MQFSIPLAVGIGGCAGALFRFYLSSVVIRAVGDELAFVGTMAVNLLGCFFIGMLATVTARTTHLSPYAQQLLITGMLGSLTTFSTFAVDILNLLQHGRVGAAVANVLMNVVAGVLLAWLGMLLAGMVFPRTGVETREIHEFSSETVSVSES